MDDQLRDTIVETATRVGTMVEDISEIKDAMKIIATNQVSTKVELGKLSNAPAKIVEHSEDISNLQGSVTLLRTLIIGVLMTLAGAATWVIRGWAVR